MNAAKHLANGNTPKFHFGNQMDFAQTVQIVGFISQQREELNSASNKPMMHDNETKSLALKSTSSSSLSD